jgi:hypothetical protein
VVIYFSKLFMINKTNRIENLIGLSLSSLEK